MSKKPTHMNKSEWLSACVSRRFASPKQELAIQTTAGVIREAVKGKGGHNSPRVPFKRKEDGSRDKKVPYGKKRWGTLGLSEVATAIRKERGTITISSRKKRRKIAKFSRTPFVAYTIGEAVKGQDPKVAKQFQKAEAYKAKITSKAWKRGRAQ